MKHASLMVVTAVDQMLIQITVMNVCASVMEDQVEEMGVLQPQPLPSQPTVEDVPFQIGLVMVTVMMEITIKDATMMVGTAVDPL